MNDLEPIKNILVCPACRSGLHFKPHAIACINCNRVYPVDENIPQFVNYKDDEGVLKEVIGKSSKELDIWKDVEQRDNMIRRLRYDALLQ